MSENRWRDGQDGRSEKSVCGEVTTTDAAELKREKIIYISILFGLNPFYETDAC